MEFRWSSYTGLFGYVKQTTGDVARDICDNIHKY